VEVVAQVARALLDGLDTSQGVRLLGVGVSGLVVVAQEPLFDLEVGSPGRVVEEAEAPLTRRPAGWMAGSDVVHERHGAGWVWGSGLGRVTIRFETAATGPGPVRTFATDDPELSPGSPWGTP
jgi:DNA polymerase-4